MVDAPLTAGVLVRFVSIDPLPELSGPELSDFVGSTVGVFVYVGSRVGDGAFVFVGLGGADVFSGGLVGVGEGDRRIRVGDGLRVGVFVGVTMNVLMVCSIVVGRRVGVLVGDANLVGDGVESLPS